jgi:Leucine-rich repeat (LRR) protein
MSQSLCLKLKSHQNTLPTDLFTTKDLTGLEIHSDQLTQLPLDFAKLEKLERLELFVPKLQYLPDWLFWNLPELITFRLKKSQCQFLPTLKHAHPKLKNLMLGHNQIRELPTDIHLFNGLETLELTHNQLHDLPDSLAQLVSLRRLNCDNNNFNDVPEAIFKLPKLSHLSMDQNPLTEEARQQLFDAFKVW